jgi:RHS repeat-associated protein
MRDSNGLKYFLTDHLGSTLAVLDSSGTVLSETPYLPFGGVRDDVGTISQTDFTYTFQRNLPDTGLMDYKARFYSPKLAKFIQPDSIVPGAGNPQSFNRYAYVGNSPINYTDPSGHLRLGECGLHGEDCGGNDDGVGIEDLIKHGLSIVKETIDHIKDNPIKISKNLEFDLPVVIPSGYGMKSGIYNYPIDIKYYGRIGGRAIGDDLLGPMFFTGWAVSVLPNQIENYNERAPWNDYAGDFVVDSMGFLVSEGAGDVAAFALIESGPGAIVANFGGDFVTSLAWDNAMESGGRQRTIDFIGQAPSIVSGVFSSLTPQYNYPSPVHESPRPSNQIITPIGTPSP